MIGRTLLTLVLSFALLGGARADEPAPTGPVVLTVTGAIGAANRGASDPFVDAFLSYHEIAFERAYAFDRAMLEGLGMRRITTRYPGTERTIEAEGPLLRDVLAAAGAAGATVSARALDGYAAELAVDEAARYDIVLALRVDGQDLGLGGRGPAWIVFPDDPAFAERGDAAWVWGAFYLRVD